MFRSCSVERLLKICALRAPQSLSRHGFGLIRDGLAMGGKKTAKRKKMSNQDSDLARKIWLAGVGAYDRMQSDAQDRAGKWAARASETFEELVAKGEEVEKAVRVKIVRSSRGEKAAALARDISTRA